LDRHATNGINGAIWGHPTHVAIGVIIRACPTVMVTMPHDVRAAAVSHHEEDEPGPDRKIQDVL
jgi:hypothetical protein